MARYKHIDTSPRFLAVDLERQLLPGTFEHALNYLIDHEIDLSGFDTRYKNDLTGAAAYPPAMLLKITLFAYSRGMVSSRNRTTGNRTTGSETEQQGQTRYFLITVLESDRPELANPTIGPLPGPVLDAAALASSVLADYQQPEDQIGEQ